MPITVDQACEVLTELGIDKDTIAILKGDDTAKIADATKLLKDTIIDNQKEILAEDPDFISPIDKKLRGEVYATAAKDLIKNNKDFISWDEYNALPEKNRFEDAVKLVAKKINEKITKGASDPELAKKIEELNAEIVKRDEAIAAKEGEVEEAKKGADTKLNEYRLSQAVETTFNTTLGDRLIAKKELLYPAMKMELESKYDLKIEDGKEVLYEKGKAVKAMKNSKPLTLSQAFEDIAVAQDAIKKQPPVPIREKLTEKHEVPDKVELNGQKKLDAEIKRREAAGQSCLYTFR